MTSKSPSSLSLDPLLPQWKPASIMNLMHFAKLQNGLRHADILDPDKILGSTFACRLFIIPHQSLLFFLLGFGFPGSCENTLRVQLGGRSNDSSPFLGFRRGLVLYLWSMQAAKNFAICLACSCISRITFRVEQDEESRERIYCNRQLGTLQNLLE